MKPSFDKQRRCGDKGGMRCQRGNKVKIVKLTSNLGAVVDHIVCKGPGVFYPLALLKILHAGRGEGMMHGLHGMPAPVVQPANKPDCTGRQLLSFNYLSFLSRFFFPIFLGQAQPPVGNSDLMTQTQKAI